MKFSTLCTISVAFGQETLEFTPLTLAPFAAILQKSAYHANISEYPGPTVIYFTGLVDALVGIIIPMFVWQLPKGRCYGNQLNLDDGCRHLQERPYSSLRRSTTDWPIVNPLSKEKMAIFGLHRIQTWWTCVQYSGSLRCWNAQFLPRIARSLTTIFIRHRGIPKRIGRSQLWFQQSNR